jgi:hypothetical protein
MEMIGKDPAMIKEIYSWLTFLSKWKKSKQKKAISLYTEQLK